MLAGWTIMVATSPIIHAQSLSIRDSLLAIVQDASADSTKVKAFMEAGKLYLGSSPDTALYYLNQGLKLAENIPYKPGIVRCRINKAVALYDLGRYDDVLQIAQSVIPMCKELEMGKELVATYNLLGNTWNLKGNVWMAVDHFEQCLAAMRTAEVPPHFPIVVNSNIAIIYNNLKLYSKAIDFALSSLQLAEKNGDELTVGIASQHLGNAYKGLQQKKKALASFQRAVDIGRKLNQPKLLATALANVADMYAGEGKYTLATNLYTEGYTIAKQNGDQEGQIYNLHGLSTTAFSQKNYGKADQLARQALEMAAQIKLLSYVQSLYLTLSDIALARGKTADYIRYRDTYHVIRDTTATEALVHAVQELETKYETEKKEEKIIALEQEKEIQQLRIRQKNGLITGLLIAAFITVLLSFLSWHYFKNRKKLFDQESQIQHQRIQSLEKDRQLGFADAVMQGQEKERTRLARDLHDGLGGMLSAVKQGMVIMQTNYSSNDALHDHLKKSIHDLDGSINELRHIARNMMPEALVRFGLKDALEDYCGHIQRSGALRVHFQTLGLEKRLSSETEIILFRIAQELLNNVVRHASASQVIVQVIREGPRVTLTIEDDGKGFDPKQIDTVQGVGWTNIRSRVNYLNGMLDIRTAPGEGCSVHIAFEET